MDFEEAREKHARWRFTFRSAIVHRRVLDVGVIAEDDRCDLGVWLHGEAGTRYGMLASYRECLSSHAAFHLQAARVAGVINEGGYEEASDMLDLGTPYSVASARVGQALTDLERDAGDGK